MSTEEGKFAELVQSHINQYGYHVTIVGSYACPRFAYTIGLTRLFSFELIIAGGIVYMKNELMQIFTAVALELKKTMNLEKKKILIGKLGAFSFSCVHPSWSKLMMLGVFDYYKTDTARAYQIIPDSEHYTLDIPDMSKEWDESAEPVWQWLVRKWDYPVPENSTVVTNIQALRGEQITEVVRWEPDGWEMFAGPGPDVKKEDTRVATLGTMLGIDKTLLPAIYLGIGKGLWRDSRDSEWNNWG